MGRRKSFPALNKINTWAYSTLIATLRLIYAKTSKSTSAGSISLPTMDEDDERSTGEVRNDYDVVQPYTN